MNEYGVTGGPEGQIVLEQRRPKGLHRLMAVVSVVVALGVAATGVALADTMTVKATSTDKWNPTHAYIGKGDVIRWRNPTGKKHDIRAYGKNWTYHRELAPGTVRRRQFNAIGTFKYRCTYHSAIIDGQCKGQCGWVHVFS